PWQKPQTRLTPQRVRQSLKPIFLLIGTPAREPKPRGKPPGWPKGKARTPKPRRQVVKKGVPTAQTA
ncbi:MAG: transposase, partial [Candidatus Bathyarchaeia archaeon]